jgi:hypothetical protein
METAATSVATAGNTMWAWFIWALAPFALPAIAGWYVWKTVADVANVENKTLRRVLTWGWAGLGAAVATSVAAPYLVWGAAAYAVWKTPLKWALKGTGAVAWAVYDWIVWAPVWAVKWMFTWAKNGFNNPTVIPQT